MNNNRMSLTSYGQWQLIKCLGSGAFGEVHHWKHNGTGQEIATKRLKPNPKLKPDEISILHKRWTQEYEWMKMLTTESIVSAAKVDDSSFLEYLKRQSHIEHNLPVIIMEYCNGGDLRGHLNKIENLNGLVEYEVRSILYTLREGIAYLHKCDIEHRDIKPENIVMHIKGNRKVYKIADFGYARNIPEFTADQSVVGTLNYVAPEVIETGHYKKSVDYWTAGNVIYEVICGTLPFIPHQHPVIRVPAIKNKTSRCIKIVQNIDDPHNDVFEYGDKLPHCNHCSPQFNDNIEEWLRLSLDKNYKTRGFNELNEFKFYSLLDEILKIKILTAFSLKKMKKFHYNIESFSKMDEFANILAADNDIKRENLFLTTPPLHPKQQIMQPLDYFVPEWCDTSNFENPPVMLYVNEFLKQDDNLNYNVNEFFAQSATLLRLMNWNPQDANVPSWLLKEFEREVFFILTEKQNLLTCYMMGLQRFVMYIQHEVFLYEDTISKLNDQILLLSGNVQLLSTVIDEIKTLQNGHIHEKIIKEYEDFLKSINKLLYDKDLLKSMYKSVLQKCKEMAEMDFYKQTIEEDMFLVKEYHSFLAQVNNNTERLVKAQYYFENCYQKFSEFVENVQRKNIIDCMDKEIRKFNALRSGEVQIKYYIEDMQKKVEGATRSLLKDYHTNNDLSTQMNTLHLDGTNMQCSTNSSLAFNCDSLALMNESLQLMEVINDQCSRMNSLP